MWHHSQQGGSWPLISSYWIDVTECSARVKTGEGTAERKSGGGWEERGKKKKCPDAYELTNVCFGCWEWSSIVGLKKHQNTIQGWHPLGGREEEGADSVPRLQARHCGYAAGLAGPSPGALHQDTLGVQGIKTQWRWRGSELGPLWISGSQPFLADVLPQPC